MKPVLFVVCLGPGALAFALLAAVIRSCRQVAAPPPPPVPQDLWDFLENDFRKDRVR